MAKSLAVANRAPRLLSKSLALRSLGSNPTIWGAARSWAWAKCAHAATAVKATEKCILVGEKKKGVVGWEFLINDKMDVLGF